LAVPKLILHLGLGGCNPPPGWRNPPTILVHYMLVVSCLLAMMYLILWLPEAVEISFQNFISSAKEAGGSPGNVSNLYFRFANLYLEFLGIIYLPICMF